MKLDNAVRSLRVMLRADTIIAEIHLKVLIARSGLYAVAALVAAFGLVMVGVGVFFALAEIWGPVWAAVAVGVGNLVLALIVILVAGQVKPSRDLDFANEIHKSAVESLAVELRSVENDVRGITSFVRSPLQSLLPTVAIPILGMILGRFRKK